MPDPSNEDQFMNQQTDTTTPRPFRRRTGRLIAVALLPLALVAASCGDDKTSTSSSSDSATTTTAEAMTSTTAAMADTSTQTIVEIASANPDFSTLVSLVGKAGLADALSGDGPFTVFAPTNEAFAKVPADTLAALAADPMGKLADVLKLHVVSGKILAADAVKANGTSLTTLGGGKIKVEVSGDVVTVGGAKVIKTDIIAKNGVIHVLDSVITAADG